MGQIDTDFFQKNLIFLYLFFTILAMMCLDVIFFVLVDLLIYVCDYI